ncbi:hypothetical protein H6G74_30820 [Nostoc spongiaeforme FACHB-130]|uniref:Uncharacterized protein n=1 Tax=Nostoc spongiaeforme FACHB-130 TaxID=1357510 RepID=A0ABR8G650_9NOSO|nr:hypothetical protein [Nostoc spongiaeforme FACHB-130]
MSAANGAKRNVDAKQLPEAKQSQGVGLLCFARNDCKYFYTNLKNDCDKWIAEKPTHRLFLNPKSKMVLAKSSE